MSDYIRSQPSPVEVVGSLSVNESADLLTAFE